MVFETHARETCMFCFFISKITLHFSNDTNCTKIHSYLKYLVLASSSFILEHFYFLAGKYVKFLILYFNYLIMFVKKKK